MNARRTRPRRVRWSRDSASQLLYVAVLAVATLLSALMLRHLGHAARRDRAGPVIVQATRPTR